MAPRDPRPIPGDLHARLEVARLDLLALFRALDRMDLSPDEIPQRLLQQLFEWDGDWTEALWALDQPEGTLDRRAMLAIRSRHWIGCRAYALSFATNYRPVPIPPYSN
jgi:hypothetical protein